MPRDSFVPIPGKGKNKINAAYAFGGPELLVQTVEANTGLRVDSYVEIGFGGFVNIIDALGGIEMCLPKAIKDRDSHIDLPKGCQNLDGATALGYVRMRKADPRGDLGRVERQREMLAAVAKKAASPATVVNPVRYWTLSNASTQAVTLDEDTSLFGFIPARPGHAPGLQRERLHPHRADRGQRRPTSAGSAVLWDDEQGQGAVRRPRPRRHRRPGEVHEVAAHLHPSSRLHPLEAVQTQETVQTRASAVQQLAGHDHPLHLVGALVDLGDLGVPHHPLDREVLACSRSRRAAAPRRW